MESGSIEEGLMLFRTNNILLVILCHTIPTDIRHSTTIIMKREKPETAVLTLHDVFDFIQEADISLDNLSGPDGLLGCVAALLKKRPCSEHKPAFLQGRASMVK